MVSAVSSTSQVYAVYYRKQQRTSVAFPASVSANCLKDAIDLAQSIVSERYPGGGVIRVILDKDSPLPTLGVNGTLAAPKRD